MSGQLEEIALEVQNGNAREHQTIEEVERRQRYPRINRYVQYTIVPRRHRGRVRSFHPTSEESTTDGLYEAEYSCIPPPVIMIIISAIEIGFFLYDTMKVGNSQLTLFGPMSTKLIYNPFKRSEVWRFFTYMFVHVGPFHLIVNLIVQILLGIPLEMVHKWWRVLIIYMVGVVAGSLATSVTDPHVFLAGASGGVYALIAAHVATIILNWSEMEYAGLQMLVFFCLGVADIGDAVYNRYVIHSSHEIGYVAHIAGAIAGLLVGLYLLRNLEPRSHEKVIWWYALFVSIILFGAGIYANIAFPEYWKPPGDVDTRGYV